MTARTLSLLVTRSVAFFALVVGVLFLGAVAVDWVDGNGSVRYGSFELIEGCGEILIAGIIWRLAPRFFRPTTDSSPKLTHSNSVRVVGVVLSVFIALSDLDRVGTLIASKISPHEDPSNPYLSPRGVHPASVGQVAVFIVAIGVCVALTKVSRSDPRSMNRVIAYPRLEPEDEKTS